MNTFAKSLLVVALLFAQNIAAQQERPVTIVDRVPFTGEIEQVLLVAMSDMHPSEVVRASWVAPHEGDDVHCVGRVALPVTTERLQLMSIILGSQGEVRSVYRDFAAEELPPTLHLALPELRDRFIERRGVYRKLQDEMHSQEERLRSLQHDADNIAMVSKIVSAEEELTDVREKVRRVTLAQQGIDRRAVQMKTRAQPLNAQKRETELVGQLSELSTSLAAAENQAIKKLTGAKGALQDKLALIEETREDHIALLEEELARLQRTR
jgi:hypothetical protein